MANMNDLMKKLNILMRARLRSALTRPAPRQAAPEPRPAQAERTMDAMDGVLDQIQGTIDRLKQMPGAEAPTTQGDDDLGQRIDRLSKR